MKKTIIYLILLLPILVAAQEGYQTPPAAIADLVNAPQTPSVSVNAPGDWMAILGRPGYISIEELAQPELKLAGLRINPRTNGSSRGSSYNNLTVKNLNTLEQREISGLPDNPKIQNVRWSPDGQRIAFTQKETAGISLWIADLSTASAKRVTEPILNDVRGVPYTWLKDSESVIFKSVLDDRGPAPEKPLVPKGPVTQESTGEKAPVRTYQDLLQDKHDEELFAYYASAQLYKLNVNSGERQALGESGIIYYLSTSPDGKYVMVTYLERPFSYLVPYYRFPQKIEMLDINGNQVATIAENPLQENIPKGFGAVQTGPRNFTWRNDQPATLFWVEAQDGGDPNAEAEIRDRLYYLEAPFDGEKQESIPFKLRFGGISWGSDQLAVSYEWWWSSREQLTSTFAPEDKDSKKVIFSQSFEDRYNDPGNFQSTLNKYGEEVLLQDKDKLFLIGVGASPEGNRPFVREYDLQTGETNQLFRSEAPYYEYPIQILDIKDNQILTRRESKEMPPNYYIRDLKSGDLTALTTFENPYPQLEGIEKEVIKYKREDGIDLKGDLYLPGGYTKEDGPLPVLMWAYPSEYKSADAASQVEGSPYEFIRLGWYSPLYFVTQGFAIFDDPSMPVVGEGETEPNDSFRKQLVANADAAIKKLTEMGICDPERVAIGGHSYGAFMTANLLAHSDLFAAGIARSGAYNRTLTPFGFQAEERTYWEAPEVYYNMSPFMHADKINEPMLMIHGEEDNNSGTYPMQSERMYAAMKGLGGKARLVMLPHESHGYQAQESILHMLWEMDQLLDKYVKNKAEEKEEEIISK